MRDDEKFLSRWAVALFVSGMIGPIIFAAYAQVFAGQRVLWSAACLGIVIEGLAVFFGVLSRHQRAGRIALLSGSLASFVWVLIAAAVKFSAENHMMMP